MLSHNPRLIEKVRDHDVFILSGHTHGGADRAAVPDPKMVCLFHLHCPQVAGWYTNGRARLYVNRGLGVTGRPFRHNCPAEISVFAYMRRNIRPPKNLPQIERIKQMNADKEEYDFELIRVDPLNLREVSSFVSL